MRRRVGLHRNGLSAEQINAPWNDSRVVGLMMFAWAATINSLDSLRNQAFATHRFEALPSFSESKGKENRYCQIGDDDNKQKPGGRRLGRTPLLKDHDRGQKCQQSNENNFEMCDDPVHHVGGPSNPELELRRVSNPGFALNTRKLRQFRLFERAPLYMLW